MKKGQIIIAAVFVLIVVAMLGALVVSQLSTQSFSAVKTLAGIQALNVAEGGIRYTVETYLAADPDWSDNLDFGPIALGRGDFSVRYLAKLAKACTFEVTGTVDGVSKKIRASFLKNSLTGIAGEYAIYLGGSGESSSIGSNASIDGDIYISGDLSLNSGTISGDATATGYISGGATVTGTTESYAPPPPSMPVLNTTYYDQQILIAGGYPGGGITYSNATLSGDYYVNGPVTLGGTINVSGSARIVTSRWVAVNNNSTIGNNLTIISDIDISIGNSVNIGTNGLWYATQSMAIGNSPDVALVVAGAGTAFLTPGTINIGNSCDFAGFIYASNLITGNGLNFDGLVMAGSVTIGNNAELDVNSTLMNYDAIPGLSLSGPGGAQSLEGREVY